MKPERICMNAVCKLADDTNLFGELFGPCEGPMLRLNDSSKRNVTIYCERHARMVEAWVEQTRGRNSGPIFQFLGSLDAEGREKFEAKMKIVILDSFIPYVPFPYEIAEIYHQPMLGEEPGDDNPAVAPV
jgi:hypothetical protein